MSSSEQYGPEVGEPDFWIGDAPEDLEDSSIRDHQVEDYDLEEFVYDNLHEATKQGGAEYGKEEFLDIFRMAESYDPSDLVGRKDDVAGVAFTDSEGKAVYGLLDDRGDTVEFDIKVFGDISGVLKHIEEVPTGGYVDGVETVDGQAYKNSAVKAGDHPMDVDTETQLSEPGESVDDGFSNAQAERIKNEVLE